MATHMSVLRKLISGCSKAFHVERLGRNNTNYFNPGRGWNKNVGCFFFRDFLWRTLSSAAQTVVLAQKLTNLRNCIILVCILASKNRAERRFWPKTDGARTFLWKRISAPETAPEIHGLRLTGTSEMLLCWFVLSVGVKFDVCSFLPSPLKISEIIVFKKAIFANVLLEELARSNY